MSKPKNPIQAIKESENLITAGVDAVEEFYYSLTGIENQQFSESFRMDLREIVKKYGVESIFEAVPISIKKYGDNALQKLIAITICNNNPKYKANYICGIIKNKLHLQYIDDDSATMVKYAVSEIVNFDNGQNQAINSVIEDVKRFNLETLNEYLDLINDSASRYFGQELNIWDN